MVFLLFLWARLLLRSVNMTNLAANRIQDNVFLYQLFDVHLLEYISSMSTHRPIDSMSRAPTISTKVWRNAPILAALAFRLSLFAFSSLPDTLENRIELSTPLTNIRRCKFILTYISTLELVLLTSFLLSVEA
jgi:hypothetical protein